MTLPKRLLKTLFIVWIVLQMMCFHFGMRDGKLRLTLLRLSIPLPDTLMIYFINNSHFKQMVDRIYPAELQLNKANSSHTIAPYLNLNLPLCKCTVFTNFYDNQDDFD